MELPMSSEKPYFNPSLMSNTNEIEEKKAEKKPKKESPDLRLSFLDNF